MSFICLARGAGSGQIRPPLHPSGAVTKPVGADVPPHRVDCDDPEPKEELEIENDDVVIREDASVLFSINLGDNSHPIDVNAGPAVVELDGFEDTNGTSSGKRSACRRIFCPDP